MTLRVYGNGKKYIGTSLDIKPLSVDSGAEFFETDLKRAFIFDGEKWVLKNEKLYEWEDESLGVGEVFDRYIETSSFDLLTAFASASGNVSLSFRVANPEGTDAAWDPLGSMNSPSLKVSAQARVSGINKVRVVVENTSGSEVTFSLYVYLGKH